MSSPRTGSFDIVRDVGGVQMPGSTSYDPAQQSYTVTGAGENVWGVADQLHFAGFTVHGDFILTAECAFRGTGGNPHRKIGVTLRQALDGSSIHADAAVHGDGLTSLQYREQTGAETREVKAPFTHADILQLERSGATIIMRAAKRGDSLAETARLSLGLAAEAYAGIYLCSHEISRAETAVFRNVRLDVPAPEGTDGYKHPSSSRMETLDVASGLRTVVYASRAHFEAPNWSRDGRYLLFNQEGRIHKLALETRTVAIFDTGAVRANNNDHGISFDGRWLALSSHTDQPGRKPGSQIYVVPIEGGEPTKITDQAPSYWHGWSPDGTRLVYCAERDANYDVWQIDARGGKETRLTSDPGLDDGPEYCPDGSRIYFCSTRTGRMKIWRMKPDGGGQEQVSFGDDNDWFAHCSPDGRRIAYVSYPATVPADSHPHNQRVTIRQQDLESGKVSVLAYLYGGQGTMNVPSWSPDGRSLAFVSYTYGEPDR